ncbi:von Willebrand factor type A [Penicillium fimorum]|uniref:von Willebrand factor type A n=1 Tax=Penicillium fimorum TaxID=1882269 RepID=A0A9W9Y429_9EURO|nr:von Willebrand factor type A [Penicillium fimorum]
MGASEKMSIWQSFSSSHRQERKERKAGTAATRATTTPTHYPSWSRGRTHSSNTSKFPREQSSDLPPPYEEARLPTIKISAPEELESDSQFAFLGQFHTIFLVDDSSSMRGALWQEAREAIAAIAPVCTKYDKEGIDIYFINHRSKPNTNTNYNTNYSASDLIECPQFDGGYYNIRTAQRVSEIFASVRPFGGTGVGNRLRNILDPYMDLVEEKEAAKRAQKEAAKRGRKYASGPDRSKPTESVTPINIITITDGVFTDDAESIIIQTAQRLDGPACRAIPWQVGIQFFQIGNDRMAQQYLEELDEDLGTRCNNLHLRDIVDTVPWRNRAGERLEGDGILKAVLGAVHKRLDRKKIV